MTAPISLHIDHLSLPAGSERSAVELGADVTRELQLLFTRRGLSGARSIHVGRIEHTAQNVGAQSTEWSAPRIAGCLFEGNDGGITLSTFTETESGLAESGVEILNNHFIAIKIDREERPDLDDIYMTAVQLMTGRGGWPLSVFLTPELKPFFGGTYFPWLCRQVLTQKVGEVTLTDETDTGTVFFIKYVKPGLVSEIAHQWLFKFTDGKQRLRKLLVTNSVQKITLILVMVNTA